MRKNKLVFSLLSLVFIIIVLFSCKSHKAENGDKNEFCLSDTMVKIIKLDTAKESEVLDEIKLNGKVSYDEDKVIKVYPLTSGNVTEVKAQLGDYVNKGQLLAVISSSDAAGFEQQLIAAESNLQIAQKNMDATDDMYKAGLASEKDFINAKNGFAIAQAELTHQKEIHKIYNLKEGSDYDIIAPISGFIVERKINQGMQFRSDNSDNIFTISGLKDVWVIANVFETDISKIKEGYDVTISLLSYPDKTFSGKIDKVFNVLDPVSKVMKVRVKLENPDYLLKPEMYALVIAHYSENKKMMSILSASVIFDNAKNYVIVYKDKCHLEIREINLYKTFKDRTYVVSGLKEGEKIISKNQLLVYEALNQ